MSNLQLPAVLTIAGSDSSAGAGIQGDLKTLSAFQIYGVTVLTSITAQNTCGILCIFDLPVHVIVKQIEAVATDMQIRAAKTGMLPTREIIEAVASSIGQYQIRNLVVDPVMEAKTGDTLLRADAQQALVQSLFPLARVVTPNIPEAEKLSGIRIRSLGDMKEAARIIYQTGCQTVLVKGGHLECQTDAVDIFYDGRQFDEFIADRVDVPDGVHGTGCAFSSAIAAGLGQGQDIVESIAGAKAYITQAIIRNCHIGAGVGVLDHCLKSFKMNK